MFIPNMWYAVLLSREVKNGKPNAFKRLGEDLIFWRDDKGKIAVMRDLCPHRQAKLSTGKIVNGNIQCAYHGFEYDSEGSCQLVPANGRNGTKPKVFKCWNYPAQEAHGFVWVWHGEVRETYPPLPYFDDMQGFHRSTLARHWNTHETRAVESVLDVSHLPFVHAKTIGRSKLTLVNGPYTTLEDDKLRVWVSNQPDEGLPAKKPTELPPPEGVPGLLLNFPNLWQLRLVSDKFINEIVFAPIDDENTMLYLSVYHKFTNLPLLRDLLGYLSNLSNLYVLKEDERVVMTQRPRISGLDVGDRFIPADRPIALYLQHRANLINAFRAKEQEERVRLQPVTAKKNFSPSISSTLPNLSQSVNNLQNEIVYEEQ